MDLHRVARSVSCRNIPKLNLLDKLSVYTYTELFLCICVKLFNKYKHLVNDFQSLFNCESI